MLGISNLFFVLLFLEKCSGILKVLDTPTRQFQTLDGFWDFLPDYEGNSLEQEWWKNSLSEQGDMQVMPVPSSFNDITNSAQLRDHLGWVWYETMFVTPTLWQSDPIGGYNPQDRRIFLRFESAHYYTRVYINGEFVMDHAVGHLPFEAEVGSFLKWNQSDSYNHLNRLQVAINNTLNATTVPPSAFTYKQNSSSYIYPAGYYQMDWQFDFFNYAGIHRPVKLYTVPASYISDILITTHLENPVENNQWILGVTTHTNDNKDQDISVHLKLENRRDHSVVDLGLVKPGEANSYAMNPDDVTPWWPYTMSKDYGFMYVLVATLMSGNKTVDTYVQKFGFRNVSWTEKSLFINGVKTYLTGINKHEDSDIRGKGLDYALIARDFENQRWLGSNAFRTSHYPYAEEYLEMADRMGIMVIGECPGVGLKYQNLVDETMKTHISSIQQMIHRDKNHPSIIMWSLANEPDSDAHAATNYFGTVFSESRKLDSTRPFTFVTCKMFDQDKALQFSDFLNVNRYIGWYQDLAINDWLIQELTHFMTDSYTKFRKPLIVQEYGAGTIPGLHKLPNTPWTEEYQWQVLNWSGIAFDHMRQDFMVGEFIWNYADFMTEPDIKRVDGNKKGIFTRQRQPKMAAHLLKHRYEAINGEMGLKNGREESYGVSPPGCDFFCQWAFKNKL